MSDDEDGLWYPTVEDVLALHEEIIEEDPDATPGIEDEDRIEFAVEFIEHGHYGQVPEDVHDKAFHLMRLLASNHWFADGNKRTALNTTELFYLFNGYRFDYGEDIRAMLKLLSVRESLIDSQEAAQYLSESTTPWGPHGTGKTELFVRIAGEMARLGRDSSPEDDHND